MKTITAEQLKGIAELANSVDQEYRVKCFELLLAHALQIPAIPKDNLASKPVPTPTTVPFIAEQPFMLPIDVKALLSQYSLSEAKIWKLFLAEGNEIRHLYHLSSTKKATVQIQHALLMALENALLTGQFQVGIEDLRKRCSEAKCLDPINFSTTLKNKKDLFKSVNKEEPLVLSPEGKSELADLIEKLNEN